MSVVGVGTDLVSVARIRTVLDRRGERFARRILTENEWERFEQHLRPAVYLSKCFAVKEAVSKALGTGISQGVSWQDIALESLPGGQPQANVIGAARKRMLTLGAESVHISLTDENDMVCAFAVLSQ